MKLYAYTRGFLNETGAAMHLALEDENGLLPLNRGFGILFAKATFDEGGFDGDSKGIVLPWVFRMADGSFGVLALRRAFVNGQCVPENGKENSALLFTSEDLISFREIGLIPAAAEGHVIDDIKCRCEDSTYIISTCCSGQWYIQTTEDFMSFSNSLAVSGESERVGIDIEDALPACEIEITDAEAEALRTRFCAPPMPEKARCYPFPLMPPRGDPMAIFYNGEYLFMATDDEAGQIALKLRRAKTLAEIPSEKDNIIFKAPDSGDYAGCLWAPELHIVGGKLCVFFAAGMPHWYTVQSRVMWLEGDDPTDAACWSKPQRMEKTNGGNLTNGEITLDMTVIHGEKADYVVWSQRLIIPEPLQCATADLMIARLDSEHPWRLASEPVVLSRPEYGWERIHSAVNEGPFALVRDGKVFLTYAAALIDHTYCVGMLTADLADELTDVSCWRKCGYPVVHRLSFEKLIGSGHNSFVKDEEGNDVMLIHGLSMSNYMHDPTDGRRYPYMHRVVWDKTGFPHFDAR